MKKLLRLLSLILSMVMTISLFTACGEDEEEVVVDPNAKVVSSSRVDLVNFEQWNPDFAVLKMQKLFGKIRRNKDPKYCHSGNYSAKVMPIGGHVDPSAPTFWIPTSSQDYNYSYVDFTYVDYITTWIYNDEEVDKDMTMGLVSAYTGFETINQIGGQTFTLKAKQWNCVQYFIDFGSMALNSNVTADNMVNIKGVYYTFDTNPSSLVEDADVFYFDDVSLIYKETVNGFNNPVSFDQNDTNMSLCDFEKVWHKNLFYSDPSTVPVGIPTVQVVTNKTLEDGTIVSPTSGARMLELRYTIYPSSAGYGPIYHKITVPETTMAEFWSTYIFDPALCETDQQGNIVSYERGYLVPREEWKKWYLTFDVYLATPSYSAILPHFFANKTNWGGNEQKFIATVKNVGTAQQNRWVTYKIPIDGIASINNTRPQHQDYYTEEYRILDPGDFSFLIDSDNETITEEFKMVYYLDSFRLTKDASL